MSTSRMSTLLVLFILIAAILAGLIGKGLWTADGSLYLRGGAAVVLFGCGGYVVYATGKLLTSRSSDR